MHRTSRVLCATLLSCLVAFAAPALALTTVSGTALDLTDTTPGQDLWRFDLSVNGVFAINDKLDIAFNDSYSSLASLGSPASFSISVTQPNPATLLSGHYVATYTLAGPSAASNAFAVGLVRSTSTLPTGLSFVFTPFGQASQFGLATIIASPVPESSTLAMLATGLLAVAFLRRKRRV